MTKTTRSLAPLTALMAAVLLSACGGDGDSTPAPAPAPTPAPSPAPAPSGSKFTKSATWSVGLPAAGQSVCYDFDAAAEVAGCAGSAWDLKLTSGGRSASLFTNSGPSGPGNGAAFGGPFDHNWPNLQTWNDATVDPVAGALPGAVYFKDVSGGVFTGSNAIQSAVFEYDLKADHQLYPNYRTFLITTDSGSPSATGTAAKPVFALQVTGYYGGPTGVASGWVSFRWVDRSVAAAPVRTASVDANSQTEWVYFDLVTGTQTSAAGNWQIAFNRYNVKLNGGASGTGAVAGFLAKTPAGFYGADGKPLVDRFASAKPAETVGDLTATDLSTPAAAANWVKDALRSALNANPVGNYPGAMDFGWYRYFPTPQAAQAAGLPATAHLLAANANGASLLRSGEGNSYARFHVTDIRYANPADANSAQTWTIHFDVQPAQ